ncbi:hypothetical protein LSUE1_G006859 [Lachnellula suecica]|uniref:DUF6594 domain-containing protein n=1 Tax=Lachnellula suecica TaxID=602035 RepID=A0A8T9CBK3_9HELO|nr:hypothetical protein LSUE1_G006859 [Lachnellula suecica]
MSSLTDDNASTHSSPAQTKTIDGYPRLAEHMGGAPEISIFRRFGALNRQNLLYLQAELTVLERELQKLEAESTTCAPGEPRSQYSRDWEWLNMPDEKACLNPQWQLCLRIRTVLREYNETLLQQAAVAALPKAESYNLRYLQSWLSHPACGNFPLIGRDHNIWTETPPRDLLALRHSPSDPFSRWAINSFVPCYHRLFGHHFNHSEVVEYDSQKITRAAAFILTILAAAGLLTEGDSRLCKLFS